MYSRLNPVKLGLAGGILSGLFLLILTLVSKYTGFGMFWLAQWMDVYPGFDISLKGAFIGFLYGFVHTFVALFLLALLYNAFKPEDHHRHRTR